MNFETFGELYQIKINGLWGKTDIVFDLYKDSNILIGENGIGKTTALKILESILGLNFIRMAKYNFNSIEFVFDTEEEIKFEYGDFIVPTQMIEDAFYRIYNKRNQEERVLRLKFKKLLEHLIDAKLIGRFLSCVYHEIYTSEIIEAVSKYLSVDLIKPLKNELEIFTSADDEINIISYAHTNFIKDGAFKKVVDGIYTEPIFSDMVAKVKFYYGEESFVKYRYTDRTINSDTQYKYSFWKCENEKEIEELIAQCKNSNLRECLEYKNLCYNGQRIECLFEDDAEHTALDILKAVKDKTGYFDINSIIKSEWHDFDIIAQLNSIALEGADQYLAFIQSKKEYSKADAEAMLNKFNAEVLYTHQYYCLPVLAEESPYKTDLNKIINDVSIYVENELSDDYYLDCLRLLDSYILIYDILSGICLDLRVRRADSAAYESLVSEFIKDKDILVTPAGLNLYSKDFSEQEWGVTVVLDTSWFIQTAAEERKIPLSKLSSGETKILALAYFALSSYGSILIMDEPELSTSIIWQETMLPVILDYGNFKSIIIATHSPYIVRDESLKSFIKYLP